MKICHVIKLYSLFFSFAYATLLILLEHWPGFGWIRSAGGIIGFPEGTHRKGAPELTQASWTLMPSFPIVIVSKQESKVTFRQVYLFLSFSWRSFTVWASSFYWFLTWLWIFRIILNKNFITSSAFAKSSLLKLCSIYMQQD